MDTLKKKLELLREGTDDTLNLLGDDAMDLISGGTIGCKKEYTLADDGTIHCGCGYDSSATSAPTNSPTGSPTGHP